MRKTAAFLYAAIIYALIGLGVWWLFDKASVIAEEFQSTTVTLVSPEESFEDAQQMVNSEASEATKAEEAPPEEVKPEEVEPEPEPEPPEPEPEPEPVAEETPEPDPQEMEEVMPEPIEEPEAPDPVEKVEEPPPPLDLLDPVDPVKALDLKKCPQKPVKKVVHKKVRKKQPRKEVRKKKVRRKAAAQNRRASVRSRARRGGSMNASRLLAQIKRRIARNKNYPRVAQRRRIQGVVRVSFTITRSGGVRGISVSGPKIFAASARSAVRRAFPINVSQASFSLPKRMSVTLRYRLH
jgi:protein TonB